MNMRIGANPSPIEAVEAGRRLDLAGVSVIAIPLTRWRAMRRAGQTDAAAPRLGGLVIDGQRFALVLAPGAAPQARAASPIAALSARELQIARAIAEGMSDKEVARSLGISEYTVREHVRRVFHKLNLSKRTALVALLMEVGRAA